MSIARHHAEWLALLDISGPFLSLPVLLRVYPQGLDVHDPDVLRELRLGYEQWLEEKSKPRPNPALHRAWVQLVLERVLGFEPQYLAQGQAIPESLKWVAAQYGETLRPDFVLTSNASAKPALLIFAFPPQQRLDRPPMGSRFQEPLTTRLMEILRATGVGLALATNGEEWMLVTSPDVSGGTTGYISWYPHLWLEEHITLRAFRSLLGLRRFFGVADDETLEAMARESASDQYELTDQLGAQVRHAVEVLIQAIDRANQERNGVLLRGVSETELYEAALTVMMRLVFLFAAEERRLFPLDDAFYAESYALSTLRANLREVGDQYGEELLERRYDAWCRLLATFRAVYGGVQHDRLNLLAYGGSLFDPNRFPFLEGRAESRVESQESRDEKREEPLPINNRVVLYILEALQILRVRLPQGGGVEPRRLSFRALDIEQIGDIYQTLLDHTAVRASEPVLGLIGTKKQEPEIALKELETIHAKGNDALIEFLQEETGRSANALKRALENQNATDAFALAKLRTHCASDELFVRVRPFANLIRTEDFENPVVILPNSVYVTQGMTRRQTQSHYTPRSLTEPLVQHTLEPLVYVGPAEGLPQEQWKLKSARELLQLKICDMAMGSASILVQVVRYLGDRLVEAWDILEREGTRGTQGTEGNEGTQSSVLSPHPSPLRITPEGNRATGAANEELIPLDADERQRFARRIVAARCIYGVDKNPLAVELAKLSLWLVTLDRNRPFTFLDHALKCGDSLVGADEDMFLRWTHSNKTAAMPLFDEQLRAQLDTARANRRELEAFDVRDVRDAERKQHLLNEANAALENLKRGCDIVVGARLLKLKDKEREQLLNRALLDFVAGKPLEDEGTRQAYDAARKVHAFHWFAEFPEVFERGGFDGFVGNPPFQYGTIATTEHSEEYMRVARELGSPWHGKADLVIGFFKRCAHFLKSEGFFSLISTSSLLRGETLESGLMDLVQNKGFIIFNARSPYIWPGKANVEVVNLSLTRHWKGAMMLDGIVVQKISLGLTSEENIFQQPKSLEDKSSLIGMLGIKLSPFNREVESPKFHNLLAQNPALKTIYVPCLGGDEIYNLPDLAQCPRAIDPSRLRGDLPMRILPETVTIEMLAHAAPAKALSEKLQQYPLAFACGETSVHLGFVQVPKENVILKHKLVVFPSSSWADFSLLQSDVHSIWAWEWGLRREARIVYSPKRCAQTFPVPDVSSNIEILGENYHEHRRQLMLARQEGLTATYNRFHNPKELSADIQRLRELHAEMDNAVAAAYGWSDISLAHGFHETAQGIRFTISDAARREVLARLLRLNHERWEEEEREKAEIGKQKAEKRKGGKAKAESGKGKRRKVKEAGEEYNARLFE